MERAWFDREIRVPLYVPVVTEPLLRDCWAVNLSLSGIGLVAAHPPSEEGPAEGETLQVEFTLPDRGQQVRARALVQWSVDTSGLVDGQVSYALGLRFIETSDATRAALARYFDTYRSHVAVFCPPENERAMVRRALADHANLHFATTEEELADRLERGDIAAVLLAGDEGDRAMALLDAIRITLPSGLVGATPSNDLAPRVVFAAAARHKALVDAFNAQRIFCVVDRPLEPHALQTAVLRACGDHGVRTEQHRVALALERALLRERARGRSPERLERLTHDHLILDSAPMREVVESVRAVAPHKISVLLQGETGTGKEVVAGLIHNLSERANAPYVVQDCGALTETLLESELFGHVKGSFTGAVSSRPGLFVYADGGTIFLDEIENTSANLQAKLLRVIETGEVRPVGAAKVQRVDVRIIAASNINLGGAMRAGRFRPDLYFRLATFPIRLPPLRERRGDIRLLAEHFRLLAENLLRRHTAGFTPTGLDTLEAYDWPGNVRELRNVIERAVLLTAPGEVVEVDLTPPEGGAEIPDDGNGFERTLGAGTARGSLRARVQRYERDLIAAALEDNDGVLRRAASALSTSPVTLGRKAKQYGLG